MRFARLALVAVLTTVGVAACGDDDGGGDGDSGSASSFCAAADEIYNPPEPRPQTEAEPEDVVDAFRRLEDTAPPEIATETRLLREYIALLFELEEPTEDSPDQDEIAAAEATVRTYLIDECGIDPSTATNPPTTSVGT